MTVFTYQGTELDFGKPFQRMTLKESILKFNPTLTTKDIDTMEAAK